MVTKDEEGKMVMSGDVVNGCFELFGGVLLWINVFQILKDRAFRGVNIVPVAFFAMWGLWNLYYYPSIDQWYSFVGGINVVLANITYVFLMFKYRRN
jgi:hypothetical protein